MNTITVRDVNFGDFIPKICVPIVGRTETEILNHAKLIKSEYLDLEEKYKDSNTKVSIIEFRADYFDDVTDEFKLISLLKKLRDLFEDKLLLFTYRSEEEGGELRHDRAESMLDEIYDIVLSSKLVDMVDVELMSGNYHVARTTSSAHQNGIKVVLSYHNFDITPHNSSIIEMIRNMEILGGDIFKIVSMPRNAFDTRRVLELCEKLTHDTCDEIKLTRPIVMISMGEIGKVSRLTGNLTGSAFTFASVNQDSAPGQVEIHEMFEKLSSTNY